MKLNLQLKPKLSKPNRNFYSLIWLVLLLFMNIANAQIVQPFTSSTTWRCPSGVTSIQVECWGAGGAGGSASTATAVGSNRSGGGGGAGSYVNKTITVNPGTDYTITVGQGGAIGGINSASGYFGNPGGKSEFSGGSITALTASGGTGGTGAGSQNLNTNPGGVLGGVYGFSVSGAASTLYTASSAVTLTGGGGSGATAVSARISGSTTYVATTNQGTGYTSAPTVSISIGAGQTFTAYVNPNINSTGDGITTILGSNGGASSSAAGGAGGASQAGIGGAGGVGTTHGGFTGANGTIVGSGGGGGFSYYVSGTGTSATGGLGANGKIVLTYDAPTITYTYTGTGDLQNVANWKDELNASPANFTADLQIFKINNSVTTTAPWTVSGTGSKIVVGDSTHTGISVTIANGFAITAPMDVTNGNKVYVQGVSILTPEVLDTNGAVTTAATYTMDYPTFGTLGDTSEVHYQNSGIYNALVKSAFTYGKLYIDGTGTGTVFFSGLTLTTTNHIVKTLFEVAENSKALFSEISYFYMTLNSGASANIYGTLKTGKVAGFVSSNVGTAASTFGSLQFIEAESLTLGSNSTIEYSRSGSATTQIISPRTDYKNLVLSGSNNNKSFAGATTVSGMLTLNITGTSTSTLAANLTVNGMLNFTAGKMTTASNTLTIGASGSITGAGTGWVIGNLKKLTASGISPSYTYAIGDATNYTPLALTFSGATSAAGGLTASTAAGDHASVAGSGLNPAKNLNRTFTLTNDALAGFGTYNATFNYASTDNDASANAASYVVRLYDGASWSEVSTSGTATTTATTVTGISSFGDFAIGELGIPPIYTYDGTGDLHDVSNWADELNNAPANFTASFQTFKINTSVTTTAPWTVSGTSSKVVVGDETHTGISLTIASGSGITATMDVTDGNKVYVQDVVLVAGSTTSYTMNFPTFGTLGDTSEVHYQNSGVNNALVKTAFTYGKLYIDGSGSGTVFFSGATNPTNHIVKTLFEVAAGSKAYFSEISYYYMTLNSGASANIYGTLRSGKVAGFVSSNVETAASNFGSLQFIGAESLTLGPNSTIEFNRASSGSTQTVTPRTDYKNLILSGLSNNKSFTGDTTVSGNLTLNITGTSTSTLAANLTVNGELNFTAGKITTAGNTLTIGASGSITGAGTGWVIGNLKKLTASGVSPSYTYAIGDATNYTPLELTFSGGTSAAGGLTASTAAGDHAGITGSGLNASKSVNRTYTLTNDALAGFGTYNATFNYVSTDNDASTTAANYAVRLYNGASWSEVSTSGTATTTATTVTGISSFGDFAIGEIITGPTAANQSVCYGKTVADLSATGTAIKWYADATGGSALSTTTVLSTSATYYVSQTIDLYESERTAVEVTVSVQTQMPTLACFQSANWNTSTCAWDVTGTQPEAPSLVCYQTIEFNTAICDWVLIGSPTASPAAESQTFCGSGTVANLVASGTALKWYAAATGGSALASNVALSSTTYYVSQTLNNCESLRTTVPVTFQTAPNAGIDGTLSLSASPSEAALFAAITGEDAGGTWTSPASGFVGVYTYTVIATAPCTGIDTSTVTVTSSTEIPTGPLSLCKGATVASVTGTTSLKFYTASTGGSPLAGTTKLASTTYYVTETILGNDTSRVSLAVIVNLLPATPGTMTPSDLNLCRYIGNSNQVTYTIPAVASTTYNWTATAGINIVPDASATDNSITVNFLNAPTLNIATGGIGTISVKSVSLGCESAASKALVLTAKVPTAPTSLIMTSTDETAHFKGIITPAVVDPPTAAVYGLVGLNTLTKITKVGPYMDTETEFILTAPAAVTAASYLWTLPTGVNPTGSSALTNGQPNQFTSASSVITVNFAGITPGTTALPIVVQSVGGCGNSTNRTLTLARSLPTAPTALVLTNATQANLSSLTKITKVGPYTDTEIPFTLTATPFTTQGATATSYAWVLPAGVVCTTCTATPDTTVSVSTTATDPITLLPVTTTTTLAAFSSPTNSITVNFSTATGIGNLDLKVFGVNGTANSIARTLVLARVLPTAPTKLVLTEGLSTTAITKVSAYTGKDTSLTLTATPFATQGAEATSFSWVLPAGVNVTAGDTNLTIPVTDVNGNKTWTSTGSVLTINLEGIGVGVLSIPFNVYAVNGAGTSAAAKTLTVTSAVPTAPTITAGAATFSTCAGTTTTYTATFIPGASYTWGLPNGASGTSITNSIVVDFTGVTIATSYAITCIATNGTGPSLLKSLTIKKSTAACRLAPKASVADDFSVIAYPNPSSSEFTIETSAKGAMFVKVYDMQGRLVEKANTDKVGSRLSSGTYNVIVNQGANTKSVRVIKK